VGRLSKEVRNMRDQRRSYFPLIVLVLALGPACSLAQPTALDVKATGEKAFYIDDRAGNNQVSIFSQSTLEDFTTVCNKVSGECKVDPKNIETFTGRFSLRVEDMRTGIELRDTHLRSPDWFDAEKNPEVVIEIAKVQDVKKTEPGTVSLKLVGTCSMHGKSGSVTIPATLTYLDETPTTMKRVKGDLIRIRAEFDVKLSDYGITGPPGSDTIGLKVSEVQAIKVTVFGSTEKPAQALQVDKTPTTTAPSKPKPPQKP
jgi:polyisoprenoid-binding protein YceI